MSTAEQPSLNRPLIGGIAALALAMGVGRFAYTPILPSMQQSAGFGSDLAGLRTLLFGPGGGPLAIALFFFGLIVTFGSAAMGAAVMGLGQPRN